MLKYLRKTKELIVQGGEDAETKKHIAEIKDACQMLMKSEFYCDVCDFSHNESHI